MVEVILRDDVTKYKPKYIFGLTKRQLLVSAIAVAVVAIEAFILYGLIELPLDIGGLAIVASICSVGYLGLKEKDGVYLTRLILPSLRHRMRSKTTVHVAPEIVIDMDIEPLFATSSKGNPSKAEMRRERKQQARERKSAKRETEFSSKDGMCLSTRRAARARGIEHRGKEG